MGACSHLCSVRSNAGGSFSFADNTLWITACQSMLAVAEPMFSRCQAAKNCHRTSPDTLSVRSLPVFSVLMSFLRDLLTWFVCD